MDKYKLTDIKIEHEGRTLYRIKALKDFGLIREGDIGGYVEGVHNLSQYGTCWIYDNAKVYDYARVSEDAIIDDFACIYGGAHVYGKAMISGCAKVYNTARVFELANLSDNVEIYHFAKLYGHILVRENVKIGYNAIIGDNILISGDAVINDKHDYIVFKNWWSSGRYFIWTRSNDMWSVGCFYGTSKELIKKAYQDNEESGREYERIVKYVESIKQQ